MAECCSRVSIGPLPITIRVSLTTGDMGWRHAMPSVVEIHCLIRVEAESPKGVLSPSSSDMGHAAQKIPERLSSFLKSCRYNYHGSHPRGFASESDPKPTHQQHGDQNDNAD